MRVWSFFSLAAGHLPDNANFINPAIGADAEERELAGYRPTQSVLFESHAQNAVT